VKISHVHCWVVDLAGAVTWFTEKCAISPSFRDQNLAVFSFDALTLILDAAPSDGALTIGFNSTDCDADFATMAARGARVLEPPADRPYGARVAYLQGPGAIKVEIEQLQPSGS
jgi:predicted enzyme related to lactoylglutathione lyase